MHEHAQHLPANPKAALRLDGDVVLRRGRALRRVDPVDVIAFSAALPPVLFYGVGRFNYRF